MKEKESREMARIREVAVELNNKVFLEMPDKLTRKRIKSELQFKLGGGYIVLCDETNNPPYLADNGLVRARVTWTVPGDVSGTFRYSELTFGADPMKGVVSFDTPESGDQSESKVRGKRERSILIYYVDISELSPAAEQLAMTQARNNLTVPGVEVYYIPSHTTRVEHIILKP